MDDRINYHLVLRHDATGSFGSCFNSRDLYVLGEPQEGQWDGFQRINSDNRSGGIVGVFRQGGNDAERQVYVNYLGPDRNYKIQKAPQDMAVTRMSGSKLGEKGFSIFMDETYDGKLFEILTIE